MSETEKPSIFVGTSIFAIVIFAIVGWVLLGGQELQLSSLYAGFLFLWYWGEMEGAELDRFLTSLVGTMVGIGLAWSLREFPVLLGTSGTILSIGLVLVALYVHILKLAPFAINAATMLFLTVGAAPLILSQSNFSDITMSALIGAVFFGCIVFVARWAAAKVSSPTPQEMP